MIRYKKIAFVMLMLHLLYNIVYAQEIKVGMKVPDLLLSEVLRYNKEEFHLLSEFKGKPLIIDFWFSGCVPCIEFMPKLDSLRKAYNDQFNVLTSTFEKKAATEKFLNSKKILQQVSLPTVTSNSALKKLFPHITEPHEVWIDSNGVVKAITGHHEVNDKNILKLINGEELNLPVKSESRELFTASKPLMETNQAETFVSSYLGSYRNGMMNQFSIGGDVGFTEIKITNLPLIYLYQSAYGLEKLKPSQCIFENVDSVIFKSDDATKKNLFCYNLLLKDTLVTNAYKHMREDLDRYFKIKSALKKQKIMCYTISKLENVKITGSTGNMGNPDSYNENGSRVFKNVRWNTALDYFVNTSARPVVDETGNDPVVLIKDLKIPTNWKNLGKANEKLKEYGLRLSLDMKNINVLIFTSLIDQANH